MTLIDSVSDDAVDVYADILEDIAHLLAKQDADNPHRNRRHQNGRCASGLGKFPR